MQLTEAAKEDTPAAKLKEMLPKPYLGFQDVFSKESFDEPPEQKQWDHAIDLKPGSRPFSMNVYLMFPNWAEGSQWLPWRESVELLHSSLKISDGLPGLLCEEERWETVICPRLPKDQCDDSEEHLPAAPHTGYYQLDFRLQGQILYKTGCMLGMQQCTNQRGRQVESHLPNKSGPLWTSGYVLQPHQYSGCQGLSPSSSPSSPSLYPPARPTGPYWPVTALILFSSWTLVCSLSISGCPSTCCFHPPSVYISMPGLWSWSWLHIPVFQTQVLIRYIVADTVGTPQLDLWGLPLCQVHSQLLFPCICHRTEDYHCQCVTSVQLTLS